MNNQENQTTQTQAQAHAWASSKDDDRVATPLEWLIFLVVVCLLISIPISLIVFFVRFFTGI